MESAAEIVGNWMSSPVHVVTAATEVEDAYLSMQEYNIRHLPVVDQWRLVGIVTRGDLRAVCPPTAVGSSFDPRYRLGSVPVAQVMTCAPLTVTPQSSLRQAAQLMLDHKVGALPVVNAHGTLVGIITEADLCRALVAEGAQASHPAATPAI